MRTTKGRRGLETALALSGQPIEEEAPGYRVPPPIKLAPVKFLERRLPGEERWPREQIPMKVTT